jgi:Fe-S cluster assembly protein SufB
MEKYEINKPGKYEINLQLNKEDEKMEWMGTIKAREPGEYILNLSMSHLSPATYSRVTIKGIAENGARVIVKGTVKIFEQAQDADSYLAMKVVLGDDKSTAIVEPVMEIKANQVKAGHGASVSKIDEEQLFYLMSRGLEKREAKEMIIEGFIN